MDTSYWTASSPEIEILETRKLMHGKFLYRLAITAVGCSILRTCRDLDEEISFHNSSRAYNWAGSWKRRPISPTDATLLRFLSDRLIYQDVGFKLDGFPDVKIRIEEPYMQFYSTSMSQLQQVGQMLEYDSNSHFYSVMIPRDRESEKLLLEGYTLRKRPSDWPFRILFRDGRYSDSTKQSLETYLKNLGDDIKVPPNLWAQLNKTGWIWGGYIFVKDANIATILHMIDGRLVTKVEEYKTVDTAR